MRKRKTKIPILQNYTKRGFDPTKDMLQSYGTGWQSANFLEQERQFFGAPGGILHDWDLKTNIDGIYAAGDQLYASDCAGFACATGYYAGRKAATSAKSCELPIVTIQRKRPASRPVCTHRSLSKMESTGRN